MKSKLKLQTLRLHNFRLYGERSFHFESGVNLLWGANAQGKTTVLEAIYLLMTGRSFRTTHLNELIQTGKKSACVEGEFEKHGVTQHIKIIIQAKERKIFYNSSLCSVASQLWGVLQGVLMTPDDVMLIKGGPGERRRFLDMQLVQVDPLYVHHLSRYARALKQRNTLLRLRNLAGIELWEHELAGSGAYLIEKRATTLLALSEDCQAQFKRLSGSQDSLTLVYNREFPESWKGLRDQMAQKHKLHREKELLLGYTLMGPHRDDFLLKLGENEVRAFASEGQQRGSVTALKIAEWHRLEEQNHEIPLMLIDDIGISLDPLRQDKLLSTLPHFGQTFLTSTRLLPILGKQFEI